MPKKKHQYYGFGKTKFLLTNKDTTIDMYTCIFLPKSIIFKQTMLWIPSVIAKNLHCIIQHHSII